MNLKVFLLSMTGLTCGLAFGVECETRTPLVPEHKFNYPKVEYSDEYVEFFRDTGDSTVLVIDRVEYSEHVFRYPGDTGPGTVATRHLLYMGKSYVGSYYVFREPISSTMNDISGLFSQMAENELFEKLVKIHGLEQAEKLAPFMLSFVNCTIP